MKKWMGAVVVSMFAMTASSAPERLLVLREDQRPKAGELELSVKGAMEEIKDGMLGLSTTDRWETSLGLRYGVTPNLSLRASVPYVRLDPEFLDSESGLGDVRVGFELVTWRDIFDYPYVMPYAEVSFPTGDEDKGLGSGDTVPVVGLAAGSTAWDNTHFVADLRYEILPDADNRFSGGLGVIHELSKQFAVSVEGLMTEKESGMDRRPKLLVLGMAYKPTPRWQISVHAGKEYDGPRDSLGALKIAYTFSP